MRWAHGFWGTPRIVAAAQLGLLAGAALGCGEAARRDGALVRAVLEARREICDQQADGVASAWQEAIDSRYRSADDSIREFLTSKTNVSLAAVGAMRAKQAAEILTQLTKARESETRTAVIDLAAQVEAFCSFASEPSGFTLVSFNEKRSSVRVELDRQLSRTALLLGAVDIKREREPLDTAAHAAGAEATRKFRAEEQKAAAEAAAELAAAKKAEEREAFEAAEKERTENALREMAAAQLEEARARQAAGQAQERQRRETAEAEARSTACRANRTWIDKWARAMIVVGQGAEKLSCDQMQREGEALARTTVPEPLSTDASQLGEALIEGARACRGGTMLLRQVTLGRARNAANRIEHLVQECTAGARP